ncbi:MAG: LegC family aminotransferase, partial [Ostreibacterium sp.]
GAKYAVATSNGTSALHTGLLLADVGMGDEVLSQPLTFVATCNAISYCHANPVFIDVDRETLGMSADALQHFLQKNVQVESGQCINRQSGRIIKACIPMHTFGHPCEIDRIKQICDDYAITLVEDAAESLGSTYKGQYTGTFGEVSAISFNGNKVITSGGGGCIITNNEVLAKKAKHLTTTAKVPHKWEYTHDAVGYNYRMPNLNAALLVAQMEKLDTFIENKRELAAIYQPFFTEKGIKFVAESADSCANYWLNTLIFSDKAERDVFLQETNDNGVMTRPIWTLMNRLETFSQAQCGDLTNAIWLAERVVNIPSSVRVSHA